MARAAGPNGSDVTSFLVAWCARPGANGHQVVEVAAPPRPRTGTRQLAGTFTLSYDGHSTDHLAASASGDALAAALEGLPGLRSVHVERRARNATLFPPAGGDNGANLTVQWAVTFLSEAPYANGKQLAIDGSGLSVENATVLSRVGYDLQPGLPGYKRAVADFSVDAGSKLANVQALESTVDMDVGDWLRIPGGVDDVYQIAAVEQYSVTLATKFYGASCDRCTVQLGVTRPGKLPKQYAKASVGADEASYAIGDLLPGKEYYVRVCARNALGCAAPQTSLPVALAPPKQKPAAPADATLLVNSGSSLRVMWSHPESDGGDTVTRYKVEWDTSPAFDSDAGAPFGVHTYAIADPANDCVASPCSYVVSSLEMGVEYYVRVSSYNSFGYSATPAVPSPPKESPKRAALPPAALSVAPAGVGAISLRFPPSSDFGGGLVSSYKLTWDAVSSEAVATVSDHAASALYSPYEVQVVTVYSDAYTLSGAFRVAFRDHATPPLAWDSTAHEMEAALEALAPCGDVAVSRDGVDNGYAWTVTFLTAGGDDQWLGDVPSLTVSTDPYELASEFDTTADAHADFDDGSYSYDEIVPYEWQGFTALSGYKALTGTGVAGVSVATLVDRFAGFEQQRVSLFLMGNTSSTTILGHFVLSWGGASTPALPAWSITAAELEAAIEGLGAGDVLVDADSTSRGMDFVVVFLETLGNVAQMNRDGTKLHARQGRDAVVHRARGRRRRDARARLGAARRLTLEGDALAAALSGDGAATP